jgi:hypothetical protein
MAVLDSLEGRERVGQHVHHIAGLAQEAAHERLDRGLIVEQ